MMVVMVAMFVAMAVAVMNNENYVIHGHTYTIGVTRRIIVNRSETAKDVNEHRNIETP